VSSWDYMRNRKVGKTAVGNVAGRDGRSIGRVGSLVDRVSC